MSETPLFVKKFDFRGVYGKDITDRDAFLLGKAMISVLQPKKVLIGYDTRVSSQLLARHFVNAFVNSGVELSYMPLCPIDYVTAAAFSYDFDLSIMFTGSHNPWDWSGLLVHTQKGDSLQGQAVEEIITQFRQVNDENPEEAELPLSELKDFTEELESLYKKKIETILPLTEVKPAKVVVDIGDGSGKKSIELLASILPQISFTMINTREVYDADSPHIADPSEITNMQDVIGAVKDGGYDAGFAFDSDADRVLGVDETGEYLNGSIFGSAMAEAMIVAGSSDIFFGYAVDCGLAFHNAITTLKKDYRDITVQVVPVGRSLLRQKVRSEEVNFVIENVGHFYLYDFFKTDSGTFSIALILYWMSFNGKLSTLLTKYPDGMREQIFLPVAENQQEIIQKLETAFTEAYGADHLKKIEVDGLRYEMESDGLMRSWFATRKSGYEPIQKYFYGAETKEAFEKLQSIVSAIVKQ